MKLNINTTIVHYWFNGIRGGEKVVEAILDLFTEKSLVSNIFTKDISLKAFNPHYKKATFINYLPFSNSMYQYYLPLYPLALRMINIKNSDLVISSESGPAKGIKVSKKIPHICYTHSPMRYVWDMRDEYFGIKMKRRIINPMLNYLQNWDIESARKLDYIVANSKFVRKRINKFWGRNAEVIYPPVDTQVGYLNPKVEDYFLLFGQHVKYKKSELAIRAFNQNGKKLIVMGTGEEIPYLKSIANGNIEFLGRVDERTKSNTLSSCRALIFPGIEDFGIIPVEAMSFGRPVIAYKRGGAEETVIDELSGMFFKQQTISSLNTAIKNFIGNETSFNPKNIQEHSFSFDKSKFLEKISHYIEYCYSDFHKTGISKRR